MSDSVQKNYFIQKTTPNDVIFSLSPVSNPNVKRVIHLSARMPQLSLPLDWALGVFFNDGVYSLYKNKAFTFNDNDSLIKEAYEAGVLFDDHLDFEPAKESDVDAILAILMKGDRNSIIKAMNDFGKDRVQDVAIAHYNELTAGVISLLENTFKIQLNLSEE